MKSTTHPKAANPFRPLCDRICVAMAAALVAIPCAASTLASDLDEAFSQKDWSAIERASLRWAQAINPEPSIVQRLAAAGMTSEAIAAARMAPPWQRPHLLLAAAFGSDLPTSRKHEIVKAAFEAAQAATMPSALRAASMASVAIAYTQLGNEPEAHQAFEAALANAKLNARDGAFGLLTDVLWSPSDELDLPTWMLDGVASHADELPTNDKVPVHRSLAIAYFRARQAGKASAQLDLALCGAQALSDQRGRRVAVQSLARVALDHDLIEFVRQHGDVDGLGVEMAAFYARRNEQAKALAEVAKLGADSLYVSHKGAAALKIINGAMDRHAIDTAMSYCATLCPSLGLEEIKIRTRIGQQQVQLGQRESAKANFVRAKSLLDVNPYLGARDVLATLELAVAAEASGMHALAEDVVAMAVRQTAYVSRPRRKAERPLSEARASRVLSTLGDRAMATQLLMNAWAGTRDLPDKDLGGRAAKAAALVAIGEAARAMTSGVQPRGMGSRALRP